MLLEASDLRLSLPDFNQRAVSGRRARIEILKSVSLKLSPGEAVGLVGESGSGKSSLGRTLVRLHEPTAGRIVFDGLDISHLDPHGLRTLRPRFQMIFQDPESALNPRRQIGDILVAPLLAYGRVKDRAEGARRAAALLERVGLETSLAGRYPHQLSGGQRQRVGIARAIALDPVFVVADEIVSGLDVSSQAQILALLRSLRSACGLSLLFISHDLSVVRAVCDRVMVMFEGAVVEEGSCEEIFRRPRHPYTAKLLDAIPLPDIDPDWIDRASAEDL